MTGAGISGTLRAVLALVLVVATVAGMTACAPRVQSAGPPVGAPALGDGSFVTGDGATLPVRIWHASGEPEAVVLALHGFNDHSSAFDGAGRFWAEQGITTYAYDQRGFGAAPEPGIWPGTRTLVADLRAVAGALAGRHPETPLFLLGESMGGAVAMTAMASAEPPAVDGLVLVAPAVWGRRTMNPLYRVALWVAAHTVPWVTVTGRGLDITPSDNFDMLIALGRDPLVIKETRIDALEGIVDLMDAALDAAPAIRARTLVLYGANDEIIPKAPTIAMLETLRTPHRIVVYPEGWHMLLRDLQAETVLADIAAWIKSPDAPLPSGLDGGLDLLRGEGAG